MIFDPAGKERFRFEGYLPPEDFLAQLKLGLARSAFASEKWDDAEKGFEEIVRSHPSADAAPEALYWAGVARYKSSHNGSALAETARQFKTRYTDSTWAKKASVWAG